MIICYICTLTLQAPTPQWSNTLKQFAGSLPTNCLCVFDNFVGLALKALKWKPLNLY